MFHRRCAHYQNEWQSLLRYIQTKWRPDLSSRLGALGHQIEVKALYVFTLSRHLIERSESMAEGGKWKPVFIEAMMLLFPMLEIVGEARLGGQVGHRFSAGVDWLRDPLSFRTPGITPDQLKADNTRLATLGIHMATMSQGPRVRELFHIRNYFTHGLKNQHDPDFDIGAVRTSMNYELPKAMVIQARKCLYAYWLQLTNTDTSSSKLWIDRLATADIYPFGIMGSSIYEQGLVDPSIVEWISNL